MISGCFRTTAQTTLRMQRGTPEARFMEMPTSIHSKGAALQYAANTLLHGSAVIMTHFAYLTLTTRLILRFYPK